MEEKKLSMLEKLNKIQTELKAPKGQYNDYGKYSYRSCEDIFEAVKPLLAKYNLVLTLEDDLINVGERYYIRAIARLRDIDKCDEMINTGWAREEETKKGMDGSQITGASSSYARKYALNGLFLIDDTKDSDSTNKGEEPTEEEAKAFIFESGKHKGKTIQELYETNKQYLQWWLDQGTNERIKQMIMLVTDLKPTVERPQEELMLIVKLQELVNATNTDYETLKQHYGVESDLDMTKEQLEDAISILEKKHENNGR